MAIDNRGIAGEVSEVRRSGTELHLDWTIPRFLELPCGGNDSYDSPPFCFYGARWHLRVWPNRRSTGEVHLSLLRDDDDGGPFARRVIASAAVRVSGGGVEKRSKEEEREFRKGGGCWLGPICDRSELREQKDKLMEGGALTFVCQMIVSSTTARGGTNEDEDKADGNSSNRRRTSKRQNPERNTEKRVTNDDEDKADGNSSKIRRTSERQNPEGNTEKSIQKLSEDLGKVLASGEKSDVTVQVGGVEFHVHSFILFVRCPALSISLRHESMERASSRVVVEECEPDIFRDFLHFLYTGSVQSLTKDNAFALYRIAVRYQVDDLKRLCLEHVQDAMSVDTFCDAVRLAMTYGESGLMERVVAFATENIQSILRSEEWRTFNRECPDEANEVLINIFAYTP